ncbi:MAG: hypothetical protein ACREUA_07610 [Burkholderiales bacterium]
MADEDKINVIREYLISEFPGYTIAEKPETGRTLPSFIIRAEVNLHVLKLSEEFLKEYPTSDIENALKNWKVAELSTHPEPSLHGPRKHED